MAVDLGLYEQADQALRRCQSVEKSNPFCAFEVAALRVYQDRFADALSEYQQATAAGASYPWLHYPAGFSRLASGDIEGALNDFRARRWKVPLAFGKARLTDRRAGRRGFFCREECKNRDSNHGKHHNVLGTIFPVHPVRPGLSRHDCHRERMGKA